MKRLLIILFLFVGLSSVSLVKAQSGWSAGQYYAYRGNVWTTCGSAYQKFDAFGNYLGWFKNCKTTVWHQQYREGYIWYWNAQTGAWYKQWQSGHFWYYTWNYSTVFVGY